MGLVVSPGDLTKVSFQLLKQHPISERLLRRAERVDVGEVGETGQKVGLMGFVAQMTAIYLQGIISVVELSFMVQEPSGIIECTRDTSLFSSFFMYLRGVKISFHRIVAFTLKESSLMIEDLC